MSKAEGIYSYSLIRENTHPYRSTTVVMPRTACWVRGRLFDLLWEVYRRNNKILGSFDKLLLAHFRTLRSNKALGKFENVAILVRSAMA